MKEIIEMKPKVMVYISILVFLFIGTVVPFLIYAQTLVFDVRNIVRICLPAVALIPTLLAIRKIKIIRIDDAEWTVKYLFTGKIVVFSKKDIESTVASEHTRYKSGIPYSNWKIKLLSGEIIQFSSNELQNTDLAVLPFRKLQK